MNRFHCGDIVREHGGRHLGTIVKIDSANGRPLFATIKWDDTKWRTNAWIDEIELVEAARYVEARNTPPIRPRTIVDSPRRKLEQWMAKRPAYSAIARADACIETQHLDDA